MLVALFPNWFMMMSKWMHKLRWIVFISTGWSPQYHKRVSEHVHATCHNRKISQCDATQFSDMIVSVWLFSSWRYMAIVPSYSSIHISYSQIKKIDLVYTTPINWSHIMLAPIWTSQFIINLFIIIYYTLQFHSDKITYQYHKKEGIIKNIKAL